MEPNRIAMEPTMKRISIRFTDEEYKQLNDYSTSNGKSINGIVVEGTMILITGHTISSIPVDDRCTLSTSHAYYQSQLSGGILVQPEDLYCVDGIWYNY